MRYLKLSAYSLALAAFFCADAISNDNYCADANGDGKENIVDITYGLAYMYDSGPPPVSFQEADFDRRRLYTIADLAGIIQCVFCDGPPIDCANDPLGAPIYPALDTTFKIIYPNTVPANVSTFVLCLNLNEREWDIKGFTLPLEILLDGQSASVDSIVFPETDQPLEELALLSNIHDSGKIVLGALSIPAGPSGAGRFAEIYLATPDSPTPLTLEVQWTTLVPKLGPPEDSSLYPLVVTSLGSPDFLPLLVGSCCLLAGDANGDGRVNIADVTFIISRIFTGGAPPPCNDAADANGDNTNNIIDITYLIARIFADGPAPVCGSTAS
ncbi:MAG: dockerin type I repeat-containing protein [candidate division Zixibacteria bacterium]|nr:dockerin type I repeat-containing protein [candidate division Zixibacteria bacterium]